MSRRDDMQNGQAGSQVEKSDASQRRPRRSRALAAGTYLAVMAAAVGSSDASTLSRIERYCTTSWRNAQIAEQDWSDCTQQAFTELLERLPESEMHTAIEQAGSESRRELNRTIWRTVQRWRRARRSHELDFDIADHRTDLATHAELDEAELERVSQAMSRLSDRQRVIITRWSEGDSIAEIAEDLSLPAARVSDEKYKAIQRIRRTVLAPLPA